jgi:hypothetical protein
MGGACSIFMDEEIHVYIQTLAGSRRKWDDNIKLDTEEMGESVDSINSTQEWNQLGGGGGIF